MTATTPPASAPTPSQVRKRPMSTTAKAALVFVLCSLSGLGLLLGNHYASQNEYRHLLNDYRDLNNMLLEAGYSGAIHDFKNYILRQQEEDYTQSAMHLDTLNAKIDTLHGDSHWDEQQAAMLLNFKRTMVDYRQQLESAKAMILAGERDPRVIDRAVAIDDSSARDALTELLGSVEEEVIEAAGTQTNWLAATLLCAAVVVVMGTLALYVLVQRLERHERQLSLANTALEASKQRAIRFSNQLKNANTELSQFAYRVSHDLKAPLRRINMLGEMAEDDLKTGRSDDLLDQVQRMRTQSRMLDRLVDGLLSLARSELDDTAAPEAEADIQQLIDDSLQRLASVIDESGAEVKVDCGVTRVRLNEFRLGQVLDNLISNACKYGDTEAPVVHLSLRRLGERLELVVKDNGPGIAKKHHEKLFGLFQRFDAKKADGNGLGLSIVKRHAERMGGSVHYRDAKPGAAFVLDLPAQA